MRGAAQLWLFSRASASLFLGGCLGFGCRNTDAPPGAQQPERAPGGSPAGQQAAPSGNELVSGVASAHATAAIGSALIQIRQRAMSLSAPAPSPRHIALGKGFVLQVTAGEAVAWGSSDGREITRVPIKEPRAVLGLPAGSVLVAALDGSYRFDPGQKHAHAAKRLSLLPGFVLEPRRGSQEQVWVLQAPLKKIQRYTLKLEPGLGLESERALDDYDGGAFTTLSDGSFLYTKGRELVHGSGSRSSKFALPASVGLVWRLAAADRIDRAWLASVSGELSLVELGARLRVVHTIHSGLAPFDFAATENRLALVSISEQPGADRRFSLTVFARDGSRLFSRELSVEPVTADMDWVASVSTNKEVVLGGEPVRVAVGGKSALRVFEPETGNELFAR